MVAVSRPLAAALMVLGLGLVNAPFSSAAALNHFQCYDVAREPFGGFALSVTDDFGPSTIEVRRPKILCAPVDKNGEDPSAPLDPDHLLGYEIRRGEPRFERLRDEIATDQFGTLVVDLERPERLLVPTAKSLTDPAVPLDPPVVDHYQCYKVRGDRRRVNDIALEDQFGADVTDVKKPLRLCLPVDKQGEGVLDGATRLMCYQIKSGSRVNQDVFVDNQFGAGPVEVRRARELCVPVPPPGPPPTVTPTATPTPLLTPTPTITPTATPTPTAPDPVAVVVSAGCTNSFTSAQSPLPWLLSVEPTTPIFGGAPFMATFSGSALLPEVFLDLALDSFGSTSLVVVDVVSTVQVRSGATGPNVALQLDSAQVTPGPTRFCTAPSDQVCTSDGDCTTPPCLPPVTVVDFPLSTDCAAAGVCDGLFKGQQCIDHGFCITGDLALPLAAQSASFTADAFGTVLFGWAEQGVPDLKVCPSPGSCGETFMPDGSYDLPASVFANPPAPMGVRVNLGGAFLALQCAMGVGGGICASGEACLVDGDCATGPCTITTDVVVPTPSSALISFPIP